MYLLVVDTAAIQSYIFGSNRLRENVGASYLVAQATGAWALEEVPQPSNVQNAEKGELNDDQRLERDQLAAEVLYAGGGNIVILFRDKPDAEAFTRKLSRKALQEAPDLQLVIAQRKFGWNTEVLSTAVADLFEQLAAQKRARTLSAPLLGLGVTVACRSTGLPAVGITPSISGEPGYPTSQEILAKIAVAMKRENQASEADERLHRYLPPKGYDYPSDFEDLGGTEGEQSYLAVVHVDGNDMGKRIINIGKAYPAPGDNQPYIIALRRFSRAVEQAAQAALQKTFAHLRINNGKITHPTLADMFVVLAKDKKTKIPFLPFRPIVFGGDDVTFVCDGRLGVSLAITYLRQFERETENLPDGKGRITACAGVVIVKTHYPFARAYALADDLCRSAKGYRREIRSQQGNDWDDSCLDWHFALGGLAGGIREIRDREYIVRYRNSKNQIEQGQLTLRPVTVDRNPFEEQRAWGVVKKGIASFQGEGWAGRRNKMKALRDTVREGESAVAQFRTMFNEGEDLPDLGLTGNDYKKQGWHGDRCVYFDAIEIADWFIPLEGGRTL